MQQNKIIKINSMKPEKNENRKLPEPIPGATPEQVAKIIMRKPPKKEWRFMSNTNKNKGNNK